MKRKPVIIGIILGVVYGLLIRLLVGISEDDLYDFMTLSFIFVTPAVIGGIAVFLHYLPTNNYIQYQPNILTALCC